jgi:predicted RecB family nuclease
LSFCARLGEEISQYESLTLDPTLGNVEVRTDNHERRVSDMMVTSALFEAYLKCPTKCFLKARGASDNGENAYANSIQIQSQVYREKVGKQLSDKLVSPVSIATFTHIGDRGARKRRLPTKFGTDPVEVISNIHAIERVPSDSRNKRSFLIPVRFVFANKLTRDDKLLIAFDALRLSESLARKVPFGKIIYGDQFATIKVKTAAISAHVRKLTQRTVELLSNPSPPDLVLNKHCVACEFQSRCHQKAMEKDDLSLMPRMTEKERTRFQKKGIFSITQLSYTFRPLRTPKNVAKKPRKYCHALKALAIREHKTYFVDSPELKLEGTHVYLDVEGIPDRDFYYLIGVRIKTRQEIIVHSFWADNTNDERRIWTDFMAVLSKLENPILIHYGSYETTFLKRMCKRYGGPENNSTAASALQSRTNLLSTIFGTVYFPTYSNGLKDCTKSLGFEWSTANASGAMSVVWRLQWETTCDQATKDALVTYNAEDCEALQRLTEFLSNLSKTGAGIEKLNDGFVVKIESLPRHSLFKFRKVQFEVPELGTINDAAYWKYQRDRILARSSRRLKAAINIKPLQKSLNANKTVVCAAPEACIKCGANTLYKHRTCSKTILDVKFSIFGIKRWVTKYLFGLYRCPKCRAVFRSHEPAWKTGKFGESLRSFSVYGNIGLGMPQQRVATFLNEVLGFNLGRGAVNNLKATAAALYKTAYQQLIKKIVNGNLIHADETRVTMKSGVGYVWVFTSLEDVVFVYASSREGNLVRSLLKDFKGVLVSDFYAVYDSVNCPQQKCIIHLIRDLNDELVKEPFNDELKELVSEFAILVKAILASVDRFGLKARFLRAHKKSVDRFFKCLAQRDYRTEPAVKCKLRLEKNRSKLFTFLDFDGVPWNNNNAEHAIKAFALLRRHFAGTVTESGIRQYLILLSIRESCRYKGLSFLEFLRSRETNVDAFAETKQRRMRNGPKVAIVNGDAYRLDFARSTNSQLVEV